MDSIVIGPNVSSKLDFKRNSQLAAKKSGKDILNQQQSPLMVYERAAVFLQQLRPNRNNSIGDQVMQSSQISTYQPNMSSSNMRASRDRINEIISKQEIPQKENRSYLNDHSCCRLHPPTVSSCSDNCSLSEYPNKYGSMEKFHKTPSSVSIHSQKIMHYQMHDCPLMDDMYRIGKEHDPLYQLYGDKFTAPIITPSSLFAKQEYSALPSSASLQNKPLDHDRLRCGLTNTNDLPSLPYIPRKEESSVKPPEKIAHCQRSVDAEYRAIGLISTVLIFVMGWILTPSFKYMDRFKKTMDRFIISCWIRWELSSIIQKNKCKTMNIVIFGPLMAIIGTMYSAFWIVYMFTKLLLSPTPQRFVRNFNFERFFGSFS